MGKPTGHNIIRRSARMHDFEKYGMLHDCCLEQIDFHAKEKILILKLRNIYLIDADDHEEWFPDGRIEVSFFDASLEHPEKSSQLVGASIGQIAEERGRYCLSTTFGNLYFLARELEIKEFDL